MGSSLSTVHQIATANSNQSCCVAGLKASFMPLSEEARVPLREQAVGDDSELQGGDHPQVFWAHWPYPEMDLATPPGVIVRFPGGAHEGRNFG
ncbi:hypothetical protein CIK75_10690 [Glutamicibacter sp. BW78]|nr:hypothetical protein CIK75_10690 [Glutamicibacter sp. BW78]